MKIDETTKFGGQFFGLQIAEEDPELSHIPADSGRLLALR
jgi:hypothetical protein